MGMNTADLLHEAETDLAFALAQGDANAEDEADARIKQIREQLANEES